MNSYAAAFQKRYGHTSAEPLEDLAPFLQHRSIRKYSDRLVPESLIEGLVACAQSASTSSSLQLWSLVSIQDPERRTAITELAANQEQVRTAPWFFAVLADHHRVRLAARSHGESDESLESAEMFTMAIVDASLAAERMAAAAESVGLGVCYIGALRDHPEKVAELLGLPDGVFAVFGLCIGYPEEGSAADVKPRLAQESVWFRETYNASPNLDEYDGRMKDFYESQGMKGDATWTMRSARRLGWKYIGARAAQLEFLRKAGFLLR